MYLNINRRRTATKLAAGTALRIFYAAEPLIFKYINLTLNRNAIVLGETR
jgi:hypothetical protein